jgi:hypothetical protein
MPTKQQIISDIIAQLTQGSPADDLELEEDQVAFWINVYLNQLVATECNEKLKRSQSIPNVYIKKVFSEAGSFEEDEDSIQDRVYIELEDEVLALNNGGGVLRVQVDDGTIVNRASVQTMNLFSAMRFAKPSQTNLLYTQEGNRIYIEGLKEVDIPFDLINIWYVPKQDVLSLSDSDEVLVSDLTLPILIQNCVETGKLQLLGTQIDTENNGNQDITPVYHKQIASPEQQ